MKKLTAGIFTSLIGLVSANTVSAAIASQGYVDSKIYALPSMEYITGNYQNLSQKLTPENYKEIIISGTISKSDLYTSLAYTDATYENLDNKADTLPKPEENKDKTKLYPSLSLVETMLSSKEDTANKATGAEDFTTMSVEDKASKYTSVAAAEKIAQNALDSFDLSSYEKTANKVSDFASIPANADLRVLYPSINATRGVAEDVIKNLGGTWQNESHYIHAAYYEIDNNTGQLRFSTDVESFLNLTPEQVRALKTDDPNEIKWGIAPNLRTVKLYVDDLKTYFDEQDELDEKLANKVTNADALQIINDMTDETAKKTKKETSYPSVAAAEAIAQIALDEKEDKSNKVPFLEPDDGAPSFDKTLAGMLVNSTGARTKYLSVAATAGMIDQKILFLDYPSRTTASPTVDKPDQFITDIRQTDGIIQPATARFISSISDTLSGDSQYIAPQTQAVINYAEALSNKVKNTDELQAINDMTDATAKKTKKETSYPSVAVAEAIAAAAAQNVTITAATAVDGKFFNKVGIKDGAMETETKAFEETINDTTKNSVIAPQTAAVVRYAEALSNKAGEATTVTDGQKDTMYPTVALAEKLAEKIAAAAVEEALTKLQPIVNVPAACSQPENYCVLTTNGTKFVWEVIARSTNDEKYPEPEVSTNEGSERLEVYTIPEQTSAN